MSETYTGSGDEAALMPHRHPEPGKDAEVGGGDADQAGFALGADVQDLADPARRHRGGEDTLLRPAGEEFFGGVVGLTLHQHGVAAPGQQRYRESLRSPSSAGDGHSPKKP